METFWRKIKTPAFVLVACVLLVAVLCWLGYWQLERAAYKRTLEDRYFDNIAAPALQEARLVEMTGGEAGKPVFAFRTIELTGRYSPGKSFLLDNQIYRSRVGYRVVSLFESKSYMHYLVDRGWIAADANRSIVPSPDYPDGEVRILAIIWPNLGLVPVLKESALEGAWPKRIQRLNFERIQSATGLKVFPYLLRLEPAQPGVFTVLSRTVRFSADRHIAYAVQWFGLALTLVVGLVVLVRKQGK